MKDLDVDRLLMGCEQAMENTWGSRFSPRIPDINMVGNELVVTSGNVSTRLQSSDEPILSTLVHYKLLPRWMFDQMHSKLSNFVIAGHSTQSKLEQWVSTGLVWLESDVTGTFIRPTNVLFSMFGEEMAKWEDIPFNTLRHTISEEKVMWDIMSGNSVVNDDPLLESSIRVSELGFGDDPCGVNVISEGDFRFPHLMTESGIDEMNDVENSIISDMEAGKRVTAELRDFRYFTTVKKVGNSGRIRYDYKSHIPDLVVPLPRKRGKPQSIAIEVELTDKGEVKYEETMERYKENIKYGSVYWLCRNEAIMTHLQQAYDAVGGTGSCVMRKFPFTVPVP